MNRILDILLGPKVRTRSNVRETMTVQEHKRMLKEQCPDCKKQGWWRQGSKEYNHVHCVHCGAAFHIVVFGWTGYRLPNARKPLLRRL